MTRLERMAKILAEEREEAYKNGIAKGLEAARRITEQLKAWSDAELAKLKALL